MVNAKCAIFNAYFLIFNSKDPSVFSPFYAAVDVRFPTFRG